MYINVVTKEIDDARTLIKNTQPTIRSFVTNKDFPLEERYRVWSEYADKESQSWIVGGKIGEYLGEECGDGNIEKHETVDYNRLHTWIEEEIEEGEEHEFFGSLDELKELLIEENFGSCEIDW